MGSHRAAGRTLRLEGRSGRREEGSGGFGTTCGLHEQSRSGAVLGMAYTWGQLEPEGWGCVRGWRGQSPEGRHAHWEELGVAQHPGASARGWGASHPSPSHPGGQVPAPHYWRGGGVQAGGLSCPQPWRESGLLLPGRRPAPSGLGRALFWGGLALCLCSPLLSLSSPGLPSIRNRCASEQEF